MVNEEAYEERRGKLTLREKRNDTTPNVVVLITATREDEK